MRKYLRNIYLNIFGSLRKPVPGVHIINSHFVTPSMPTKMDSEIMDNFLGFLTNYCKLITIQHAIQIITSDEITEDQCMVAFTFDDGFGECYTTIAPLLEKYNCNAAFFINSNYIESDEEYQKQFNSGTYSKTKKPMKWNQIIDLHRRGHVIGSHTLDHKNLAELNELEIEFQIRKNKEILTSKLNYDCDYFAWTFGRFEHFSKAALKITQKYHKYIFSGTDYKNYYSYDGQVLNRRHIEPDWNESHIKYFLSVNKKSR